MQEKREEWRALALATRARGACCAPRFIKKKKGGFPGGAVVESLPANAGDAGSSPGLGGSRVPRSNWAREPQLLSLRVWSLCSATREAVIASLVVQWLRIRLPAQGTQVRALVWEDPTCHGATKPVQHNY
ncbi:hypothetical protein J1605_007058 [Eschrichtius robustus]|uniref:Uncharacterized protein n=1 Tax=Eschrichtius robustus TaxID=9764 RepID=A0AB34H1B0_ESCRO|nr:hypothetical protein J1605_007058 [Eschrichtius robustus]